jgi:hypothetical protein
MVSVVFITETFEHSHAKERIEDETLPGRFLVKVAVIGVSNAI